MSPIIPESELGRLIAIKKELGNLLTKISAITNMSNTNIATIKLRIKLIIANIKRVKALRTSYLQSFNNDLNSINSIISSGETIKNININSHRLNSLISNLDTLSLQTTTAIVETANLVSALDLNERRELGITSNSRSRPVPRLPSYSAPPPLSAPPRLQRQSNIGTRPTSLVRQPATHLSLDDLDLALTPSRASSSTSSGNAYGKKYLRPRKMTRRKRGAKKSRRK
jgi:hypothetical protein